jgi:hypothetical protein
VYDAIRSCQTRFGDAAENKEGYDDEPDDIARIQLMRATKRIMDGFADRMAEGFSRARLETLERKGGYGVGECGRVFLPMWRQSGQCPVRAGLQGHWLWKWGYGWERLGPLGGMCVVLYGVQEVGRDL